MSVKFICDNVITASQYLECYTDKYYSGCDTFEEAKSCALQNNIRLSNGWRLSEIDQVPANTACVLVEFSTEWNYSDHEYRIMPVQKKYLSRFKANLEVYIKRLSPEEGASDYFK